MAEPTKWFHWLLLYPALATSLWAAVPALWQEYKAWQAGVTTSELRTYQQQAALWQANLDCLQRKPTYLVTLDPAHDVGVTICTSGDVLVRYASEEARTTYQWVAYPGSMRRSPAVQAVRQSRLVVGYSQCVGAQIPLAVNVVHALPDQPGVCVLEIVHLATGQVTVTRRVHCETFCEPS